MPRSPNAKILLGWAVALPAGLALARIAQLDLINDRKKKVQQKNEKRKQKYLQKLEQEKISNNQSEQS